MPQFGRSDFEQLCLSLDAVGDTIGFKDDAQPTERQYVESRIAWKLFEQAKAQGGKPTIVLEQVEHVHTPTRRVLRQFDVPWLWSRLPTVFMTYSSPQGGIGVHFDDDDNIVVQVQGSRLWRVSRDPVIPSYPNVWNHDIGMRLNEQNSDEWILGPGDLLYIPRGHWHEGISLEESISVTFGWDSLPAFEILAHILVHKMVTQPSLLHNETLPEALHDLLSTSEGIPDTIFSPAYKTLVACTGTYLSKFCPEDIRSYQGETLFTPDPRRFSESMLSFLHDQMSQIAPIAFTRNDVRLGLAAFVSYPLVPRPAASKKRPLHLDSVLVQSDATVLSYSVAEKVCTLFAFGESFNLSGKWERFCQKICNQLEFSVKEAWSWIQQERLESLIEVLTLLVEQRFLFHQEDGA
jgi:hypothetical protein